MRIAAIGVVLLRIGSGLLGQDLAASLGRERDDQQADGECDRGEGDWRAESAHGSHGSS